MLLIYIKTNITANIFCLCLFSLILIFTSVIVNCLSILLITVVDAEFIDSVLSYTFYLLFFLILAGEYVGLTGSRLDGAEMLVCGLATHFVPSTVCHLSPSYC